MKTFLLHRPSAFLPLAMSLGALALVLGHVAVFGVTREADEGTAAHLFQLLMAGQVPIVAFFVLKWLPQAPRQGVQVLALQVGAALAAFAPVYFLNLCLSPVPFLINGGGRARVPHPYGSPFLGIIERASCPTPTRSSLARSPGCTTSIWYR